MNILTVIHVNEIKRKGFAFLKDNLKEAILQDKDLEKMDKFWNYFEKYWLSSNKMIESWNIFNYKGNKNVLRRTNNGLEFYNLRMKLLFKSCTSSFAEFVNTMRHESEDLQKIGDDNMNQAVVKRGKYDENDGNFIYQPPPCYATWEKN